MEDFLVVKECLKNNRKAQHQLFDAFKGRYLSVIIRYVGNKHDAEDIMQDGFVKLFDNLHKFSFSGSLEGWGRRIMITTAIDFLRKKKNLIALCSDLGQDKFEHYHTDFDGNLQNKYLREIPPEHMAALIIKLPVGCRTVFNLFAVEGYTHRVVAEVLGITTGASKSNYSLARKKMREFVTDYFSKTI